MRAPLAQRIPDAGIRRSLWYRLVDSDVFSLLRAGNEPAARQRFLDVMGVGPE